jgi:predicted DNA-binding transcriptional regulator YafY
MRADRLLSILMLLQARGRLTTGALAEVLAVSRRTVLRDIEALSQAGVPIYTDSGHGGGVSLDEGYRTTLTGLRESEVRALFVDGSAQLLRDIGLGDAVDSGRRKLNAALPPPMRSAVDAMQQRVYIDSARWWHSDIQPDFWPALQHAVFEDERINVRYTNYEGAINARLLEPYSLVSKSGVWYLVAKRDGALRTYRVDRVLSVTATGEHFARDPHFDLATVWQTQQTSFRGEFTGYAFTAEIQPDRMGFVRWINPGQHEVIGEAADGWVRVRFAMESEPMAVMRLFAIGPQMRILTPRSLASALKTACSAMLAALQTA